MATPTYNAEGQAIWKPQPGQLFPDGMRYVHSYGGIVATLKDLQVAEGKTPKTYPNNFAGIIAALEDLQDFLTEGTLPDVGAPPPGWEIIDNPDGSVDGEWQYKPQEGSLWFDTRQGRMFIFIDNDYIQTNGADGISHVGPEPPTNPPVVGQHWLDTDTGLFYVYVGRDPDTGQGLWQAVVSDGDITVTTATLPLAIARTTDTAVYQPTILPELPPLENMQVQKEYNTWLMEALVSLDKAVTEGSVTISEDPPTDNVVAGTLWYDSNTLELSIYYQDDDSAQWVPVSVGYEMQLVAGALEEKIDAEVRQRGVAIDNLYATIAEMDNVDDARVDAIETALTALTSTVNDIQIPDVSPYATINHLGDLIQRVAVLENDEVDLSNYATSADLQSADLALRELISSQTYLELSDITPLIPDVSNKLEASDLDALASVYLPQSGGTLAGTFNVQKSSPDSATFDASHEWYTGTNFLKLQSYSPNNSTTTLGTTNNWWEVAWKFKGEEDFAWIHNDSTKVFSVNKEGPACSKLYMGDFRDNDSNGRSLRNKIEVGDMLRKHHQALTSIKTLANTATDFETLKVGLQQALTNI